MNQRKNGLKLTDHEAINNAILDLVSNWQAPEFSGDFAEMIASLYRLSQQNPNSSDLVLFKRSLAELRYAQSVFAPYRSIKKICVFGSARIRPPSKIYTCATDFTRLMTEAGYMTITGAGDGIMSAAQSGAGAKKSFGLNIMLPFEQRPNEIIRQDPKLVTFRYFFTRKLTFLRETSAVVIFPGGFGTLDEAMEVLTLLQTGKARIIPVVLIDEPGGTFWKNFLQYISEHLMANKLISPEDFNLFRLTASITEARDEILRFYRNFHSYRFVGSYLVIRLHRALSDKKLAELKKEFLGILEQPAELFQRDAFPQEANEKDLAGMPRLCLTFNRIHFGYLRLLIDRINQDI
ncbi:MAG TPA: LOG family protein [Candidatus Methylacidiphilales bacterium]|nr:LOG family protein [Candidatus Methylacidiphilales bacterium]